MHYWDFFPTGEPELGCIPVWGFATVRESRVAGSTSASASTATGRWPTRSCSVRCAVGGEGFVDEAAHRSALPGGLQPLPAVQQRPGSTAPDQEALIALLRPLFITSFLIDDFLADNAFFGAPTVLMSSASSKTAYGLAFCLARRRGAPRVADERSD